VANNSTNSERIQLQQITGILREYLRRSTAPLYWHTPSGDHFKNGTIFFVDTGTCLIGITAYHVYEGYISDTSKNKINSYVYEGAFEFNMKQRFISGSKEMDIATFSITKEELNKINKRPLDNKEIWPPNPPRENQGIFTIGYPGKERLVDHKNRKIEWGYIHILCVAKSVANKNITIQLEREYIEPYSTMPFQYDVAGISGAPVLVLENNPIFHHRLGGIIYEASIDFGLIFARPASVINVDGSISTNMEQC